MKRVMTYVIAAVFAFCLFTLLPAWAMNETNAFSVGRQETDINIAQNAPPGRVTEQPLTASADYRTNDAPSTNSRNVCPERPETAEIIARTEKKFAFWRASDSPPERVEGNPSMENDYPLYGLKRNAFNLRL